MPLQLALGKEAPPAVLDRLRKASGFLVVLQCGDKDWEAIERLGLAQVNCHIYEEGSGTPGRSACLALVRSPGAQGPRDAETISRQQFVVVHEVLLASIADQARDTSAYDGLRHRYVHTSLHILSIPEQEGAQLDRLMAMLADMGIHVERAAAQQALAAQGGHVISAVRALVPAP